MTSRTFPGRGATLIEVMVVGSIFFALLLAIWLIYESTVRVERLITLKSDIDRTLMTAVRHVDATLRSSRLVEPADWTDPRPVESIKLEPLSLDENGEPRVTAQGLPEWGEPFSLSFENRELVRIAEQRRSLGNLGEGGSARFIRRSKTRLEMAVVVEKVSPRGEKGSREMTFPFRLFNQ